MQDVFVISAARTAIETFGGTFKDHSPTAFGAAITNEVVTRAGLGVYDLDVIETNEAFAAQTCAVACELEFDPNKVNPNGSGISLGHLIGATSAIIATKLVHELQRTGGRCGLAPMCV